MPDPFLSDEWIAAAREIRARHGDEESESAVTIKMNQVITEVPFGTGTINSYLDTSTGSLLIDVGHLDDPDVTITTDYDTAKQIFVDQNQDAAMQAFMSGKIRVQGDMMKLLALQTALPDDERASKIAAEIREITA